MYCNSYVPPSGTFNHLCLLQEERANSVSRPPGKKNRTTNTNTSLMTASIIRRASLFAHVRAPLSALVSDSLPVVLASVARGNPTAVCNLPTNKHAFVHNDKHWGSA